MSRPGLEPEKLDLGQLDPETSALTMKPTKEQSKEKKGIRNE